MVESLEGLENVMAAELGFAPLLTDDIILTALEMSLGELPLIVSLPHEQVLRLGPQVVASGAAAVSLAAGRGMLKVVNAKGGDIALTPGPSPTSLHSGGYSPAGRGELIAGRLYGPSLFPQALALVRDAARVGIPVIGSGGVWKPEQAEAMKEAGAIAVQLDAVLWRGGFGAASGPGP